MRKLLIFALTALLTLTGCADSVQAEEPAGPAVWLDYLADYEDMSWDEAKELDLPEAYPGVTFRWTADQVSAIMDGEEAVLFSGMPVWSVFLQDLNGDGKPELCANASWGFGMIDERVLVCDYAAGALYTLEDRGHKDYTLSIEEDRLVVTRRDYPAWPLDPDAEGVAGTLALTTNPMGTTVLEMICDKP